MGRPTAGIVGFIVGLTVLLAVAAGIAIEGGMESDRRLSKFCSSLSPGSSLDEARGQAAAQGYAARDSVIASPDPAIEAFETRTLWPRSWCRLDHDGVLITGRTFNPWYE